MFDSLPNRLREAAKLTSAGRLKDATTAIQRLLSGQPETSPPNPNEPFTIDGTAQRVEPSEAPRSSRLPVSLLGKVNLRDLVRRKTGKAQGTVEVPHGAQFLAASFTNQAGTRPYKLYVPASYRATSPTALVVMLHGCTQSPDDFAAGTRMNEHADEQGFLVAYPGQTGAANMQKCWNWFQDSDQHRNTGEPSLIAGITRAIMAHYAVDPGKIYVAGLSAGGALAAIMAQTHPDLYAAIGVHSGLARGAARDMPSAFAAMRQGAPGQTSATPSKIVPTIVFHGDKDTTVDLRNADFVIAQATGHEILTRSSQQGLIPGGHAYTRALLTNSRGNSVIEQWILHGANHAWSGGNPAGSYTDPQGPDATKEMVRFFQSHARGAV